MKHRTKKEREIYQDRLRAIIPVLDHQDCHRIARALDMHAVVLEEMDRSYPDPDRREHARAVRELARDFYDLNQARKWIEKGDQID